MPKFNELTAASRRLFEKVEGFNEFSVDTFDTFIIDENLAADPETDDSTDPRFKGFVQQRGVLKNKLDRAAKHLPNGTAYRIQVKEAGKSWMLVPLADAMDDDYEKFGDKAAKHVENSMHRLRRMESLMRGKLLDEHDSRLQQVLSVNSMMMTEAIGFTSQVKGLVRRYDAAYSKANEIVTQLAHDVGIDVALLETDDADQ